MYSGSSGLSRNGIGVPRREEIQQAPAVPTAVSVDREMVEFVTSAIAAASVLAASALLVRKVVQRI